MNQSDNGSDKLTHWQMNLPVNRGWWTRPASTGTWGQCWPGRRWWRTACFHDEPPDKCITEYSSQCPVWKARLISDELIVFVSTVWLRKTVLNSFKEQKSTQTNCIITVFSPRIPVTANYYCIIWCSLPATVHWHDMEISSQGVNKTEKSYWHDMEISK